MNIDDYTKITHKRYSENSHESDDKKVLYIKNLITRLLLSIILVISICIFIKIDNDNTLLVEKYFFDESIQFTKINNWYQDKLGKILPDTKTNTKLVFNSDELLKNSYTDYQNGIKINLDKNTPISLLNGGVVVFIGEKENFGNTLIIQGNNGIDYWYGGLTNTNVNLYDYLEKDTLVGETINDYLYLVLEKDGKYIKYDEIHK